jgi:hypothetical protein
METARKPESYDSILQSLLVLKGKQCLAGLRMVLSGHAPGDCLTTLFQPP